MEATLHLVPLPEVVNDKSIAIIERKKQLENVSISLAVQALALRSLIGEVQTEIMQSFEIKTDAQMEKCEQARCSIKDFKKSVIAKLKPIKDEINAEKALIMEEEHKHLDPVDAFEEWVNPKLSAYAKLKEAQRLEEERRLQAEAQRQAEEEARKAREEALRLAEEEKLAQAMVLEQNGDREAAEAVIQAPVEVAPIAPVFVPSPIIPKTKSSTGTTYRDKWRGEVTSIKELCRGIAEGLIPEDWVEPRMTPINSSALALKDKMNYPGIRAVCEKIPVDGRRQ